jgi:hypothetical protein
LLYFVPYKKVVGVFVRFSAAVWDLVPFSLRAKSKVNLDNLSLLTTADAFRAF